MQNFFKDGLQTKCVKTSQTDANTQRHPSTSAHSERATAEGNKF